MPGHAPRLGPVNERRAGFCKMARTHESDLGTRDPQERAYRLYRVWKKIKNLVLVVEKRENKYSRSTASTTSKNELGGGGGGRSTSTSTRRGSMHAWDLAGRGKTPPLGGSPRGRVPVRQLPPRPHRAPLAIARAVRCLPSRPRPVFRV